MGAGGGLSYDHNYAADGNTKGHARHDRIYESAKGDLRPWWQVDLKSPFKVDRVAIYNRTDCCSERLSDLNIVVLDRGREVFRHKVVGKAPVTRTPGGQELFILSVPGHVAGDAVRIEKVGETLQLPEVEVWGTELEMNEKCRNGDIKPKVYAIRLVDNRSMCWKWTEGSNGVEVTDDCKSLDDPRTHFIFDTKMRIHSGVNDKEFMRCLEINSAKAKNGDSLKGGVCGDQPTQKFLANLNMFKKVFHGCPGGTTKPMKYYPTGYGRVHVLSALDKCVGIEGALGAFEGAHGLALDECTPDLRDQVWEIVPVSSKVPRPPRQLEAYRAALPEEGEAAAPGPEAGGPACAEAFVEGAGADGDGDGGEAAGEAGELEGGSGGLLAFFSDHEPPPGLL
eukprot:tig00001493_g8976.t1